MIRYDEFKLFRVLGTDIDIFQRIRKLLYKKIVTD
jgi:hypothetical protein